jgi:hypothetical protein
VTMQMRIVTRVAALPMGHDRARQPYEDIKKGSDAEIAGGLGMNVWGPSTHAARGTRSLIRQVGPVQLPNCSSTVRLVVRPQQARCIALIAVNGHSLRCAVPRSGDTHYARSRQPDTMHSA